MSPNVYSIFTGIQIGSGVDAIHYDFCEHIGVKLSGYVYHDRDERRQLRSRPRRSRASAAWRSNCCSTARRPASRR